MEKTKVETLFDWFDDTVGVIKQHHDDEPYLDSLATTLEILFYEEIPQEWDDLISHKITLALKQFNKENYHTEDMRKAIQLAILKGMKESTQPQHHMTPETVTMFIGFLAHHVMGSKQKIRIFDPACGSANLLTGVMRQLPQQHIEGYASEIDPTLLRLAVGYANLQQLSIEFFHQDSLRPFLLDPVDLVVADLPVGYYPDDENAQSFSLKAKKGHSFAHHLFIEQSLTYMKEEAYAIFLIPEFLFESEQSEQLRQFLHEHAHIVGVLRLPDQAFTSKDHVKSIFIIQKQGANTNAPKQPLLANLPSFQNKQAIEDIVEQINAWFVQYHQEQ